MKDKIFAEPLARQFEFNEKVATVFDDMILRSVPFYKENMELIVTLLSKCIKPGMRIVDLGSSTGSLLIALALQCGVDAQYIGVDNAKAMVGLARKKAEAMGANVTFICRDIMDLDIEEADIIISNYTLQFIRPAIRQKVMNIIASSLKTDGIFVCSEKILMQDKRLGKQMIDIYHDYKQKQGYSKTEIMRKREALENVLIPYTIEENISMMKECGFKTVDTLFQWGNFATMCAFK